MISLFGSCIRTEKWLQIYKDIKLNNKIKFELVFCGSKKPDFVLPDNFKYIYAKVKPTQCWSIAGKATSGELVSIFGDDLQLSEGCLDKIYECYKKEDNTKAVITPYIYYQNDWHLFAKDHFLVSHNSKTPNIPQGLAFYNKKFFDNLNGCDKRFIAAAGDYDLFLRSKEQGGYLVFCKNVWQRHESNKEKNKNYLYKTYKRTDRPLLYELWLKDGKFLGKRTSAHIPFSYDDSVYNVTQIQGNWVERI